MSNSIEKATWTFIVQEFAGFGLKPEEIFPKIS